MSLSIHDIVDNVSDLVSLPEISLRVNEMVDNPKYSANDFGQVISQDPALTVRLLKVANSPFYGLSSEVDNVSRAVTLLGTRQLRDIVLSISATKAFEGIPNDLISVSDFWYHSLYCGILAQHLADACPQLSSDSMFTAGLLHDIGHLVMFNRIPDLAHSAILLTIQGPGDMVIHEAEREIMGFDHSQVGAELARVWQLPAMLQECIEFHHEPEKAEKFPLQVALIYIADCFAALPYKQTDDSFEMPQIDAKFIKLIGLSEEQIQPVVLAAQEQIAEVQSLLFSIQ